MRTAQIVVIGAGGAGLSAALAAASAGASVTLVDEWYAPGGTLRWRVADVTDPDGLTMSGTHLAADLARMAQKYNVTILNHSVVWGLFADGVLGIAPAGDYSIGSAFQLRADRVILATGSTDLPFPFPGGSLPGVYAARAVQRLLHEHRVCPGRQWAVIGTGDLADEITADLDRCGAEVSVRMPATSVVDGLPGGLHADGGADGVERLTFNGETHSVDAIAIAVGRQPDAQLALMAGCEAARSEALGGFVPLRDDTLHTSQPHILVCGSGAGLADVPTAMMEGRFAGLSAAADLGFISADDLAAAQRDFAERYPTRTETVAALTSAYIQT